MALPIVEKQLILDSIDKFDLELRNTDEWKDWDTKKSQVYAIDYNGQKYPPKKIVSMATGITVSEFVGGAETNDYLGKYNIKVIRLRELTVSDALKFIAEKYDIARKTESFKGGNSIRELFDECRRVLNNSAIIKKYPNIKVVSSYGKGNWATIPWISFLDTRETNTTQDGTYIVILFCEKGSGCYIKMAQGVTQPTKQHGAKAVDILHERAAKLRAKYMYLKDGGFDMSGHSDLGSDQKLAKLYEASTVASKFYDVNSFPSEEQIYGDLGDLLECYNDYVRSRDPNSPPAKDSRELVLLGTWREIASEYQKINDTIENKGAWAFWWSFRINQQAEKELKVPFYLYINAGNGEIPYRIKISEWLSSPNNDGIITPWPNETPAEWQGINSLGSKQSEKFITWAKAIAVERLQPVLTKDDFDPAPGLSTKENLLNQMVFGYAYVDAEPEIEIVTQKTIDELVPSAITAFKNVNLRLQNSTVIRYASSLLTKRFVILTGLSGSGKTKLAEAFSLWISKNPDTQIRMVSVGADWTNREPLLGYPNALEPGRYVKPDSRVLDLILNAISNPDLPHFLILDEMNMSHVERYFADFLSAMESSGRQISLHPDTPAWKDEDANWKDGVPDVIELPKNLFIIGTVNIDETTYMFSPKVLDRAQVIEFRVSKDEMAEFLVAPAPVDMNELKGSGAPMGADFVLKAQQTYSAPENIQETILPFFDELQRAGAEFGYRTASEMSRFVSICTLLAEGKMSADDVIDAAIMQKLLPKVHGSRNKIEKILRLLGQRCLADPAKEPFKNEESGPAKYPVSYEKIERMHRRVIADGFTSYAEA